MDEYPFMISVNNVKLDRHFRQVFVDQVALKITPKEYLMLEVLMQQKGSIVSRDTLLKHLYGGASVQDGDVIDIFVRRLRKKLADAGAAPMIVTSWKTGFKVAG